MSYTKLITEFGLLEFDLGEESARDDDSDRYWKIYKRCDKAERELTETMTALVEACKFVRDYIERVRSGEIGPANISEQDVRLITNNIKAALRKAGVE